MFLISLYLDTYILYGPKYLDGQILLFLLIVEHAFVRQKSQYYAPSCHCV